MSQQVSQLYEPVLASLEQVKESLLRIVPPDSELLAQTLHHSLGSGGKLLRPVISLLAGQSTGPASPALVEVGAVAEMIHIATLLHDDVLDQADLRRGKKTVRAGWGNTVSVLSGDFLLAQASLKLAAVGNIRIVGIFSQVLADLCDGEVEQIRTSYTIDTPWDSYFRKTICKTASLFAAGCEAVGVVNALPEEQVQALKTYGRNFGISFQIMDDLLDYTSSEAEMGKPVMDDLRNGLLNAPVLLALESDQLSPAEKETMRAQIQQIFQLSQDETKQAQATEVVMQLKAYLEKSGAIENTVALAARYADEAIAALDFVDDSPEKHSLVTLLRGNLSRRH